MLLAKGRHPAGRHVAQTKGKLTEGDQATCDECGHPGARPAASVAGRAWRRVHPRAECFHAVYEYSVLRDGWCGCRSKAHRG